MAASRARDAGSIRHRLETAMHGDMAYFTSEQRCSHASSWFPDTIIPACGDHTPVTTAPATVADGLVLRNCFYSSPETAIAVSEARAPPDHRPGGAFFGVVVEARERSAIDVAFDADGALSPPSQFILAPLARPYASLLPLRNRCRVGGASPLNWAVIAKLSQCCAVTSIIARSIGSAQALPCVRNRQPSKRIRAMYALPPPSHGER